MLVGKVMTVSGESGSTIDLRDGARVALDPLTSELLDVFAHYLDALDDVRLPDSVRLPLRLARAGLHSAASKGEVVAVHQLMDVIADITAEARLSRADYGDAADLQLGGSLLAERTERTVPATSDR